ncbi:MAG: helix-hairpin-helix domain-containing protein [Eubacteriales bacterium]
MPLKLKIIAGVAIIILAIALYIGKSYFAQDNIMIASESNVANSNTQTETIEATAGLPVNKTEIAPIKQIVVDISGEVNEPKVVTLPEGSRVYQAIELAGGLKKTADKEQINQAALISDGEKIFVPKIGENIQVSNSTATKGTTTKKSNLININTADLQLLDKIQGVGPVTAENIILFREANGKYKTVEDIKNVDGIGDKTYEKLKTQICVN